jgi:hypothetical protein
VVQFAVTGGALVGNTSVNTVNGVATITFLAPSTNQSVTVAATLTGVTPNVTTTGTITVGPAAPSVGGDGQFSETPTNTGSAPNLGIKFGGGTLVEFQAAANELPAMSRTFVQKADGTLSVYVTGGGVVNAPFNSTFAAGVDAGTNVIIFLP